MATIAALGLGTLAAMAAGFFVTKTARPRAELLAAENELLAAELSRLDDQLATLEAALGELSEQEAAYRVLAGLQPLGGSSAAPAGLAPLKREPYSPRPSDLATADLDSLIDRAQRLAVTWRKTVPALSRSQQPLDAIPSILPAFGFVSRPFGLSEEHPLLLQPLPHEGIDITAPEGTPVVAAAAGRVRFVGEHGRFGLMVELDHDGEYVTRYAHLKRTLVTPGETVERGAQIGVIGHTGVALGPHVHYEVLVDGRPRDPTTFILSDLLQISRFSHGGGRG